MDITIEDLWKKVNEKIGRQKIDKEELNKYRVNWEKLVSLIPKSGEILSPAKLKELIETIRSMAKEKAKK